jgi:hypothetical protein
MIVIISLAPWGEEGENRERIIIIKYYWHLYQSIRSVGGNPRKIGR